MAQGLFYFLLNKYLHVTVLFGIIKQITHGSEGDIIFFGLIICTVTLTAMCYLYTITCSTKPHLLLQTQTEVPGHLPPLGLEKRAAGEATHECVL